MNVMSDLICACWVRDVLSPEDSLTKTVEIGGRVYHHELTIHWFDGTSVAIQATSSVRVAETTKSRNDFLRTAQKNFGFDSLAVYARADGSYLDAELSFIERIMEKGGICHVVEKSLILAMQRIVELYHTAEHVAQWIPPHDWGRGVRDRVRTRP